MVQSRISHDIEYREEMSVMPEDRGKKAIVYEIEIMNVLVKITIGREKYEFEPKGVIYYPIYLLHQPDLSIKPILKKIGVFEINKNQTLKMYDEDGDIDIDKFTNGPLIFSIITEKFLKTSMPNKQNNTLPPPVSINAQKPAPDYLTNGIPITKPLPTQSITASRGIFEIDPTATKRPPLPEETEADAEQHRREFKEGPRTNWIQQFTKNPHYGIMSDMETTSPYNTFCEAIRTAYATAGMTTTISRIKNIIADNLVDADYRAYKRLQDDFVYRITAIKQEADDIAASVKLYANRMKKNDNRMEQLKMIKEVERLKQIHEGLKQEYRKLTRLNGALIKNQTLKTFEEYRAWVRETDILPITPDIISATEIALKCKFIILEEDAFAAGAEDEVLNCGRVHRSITSPYDPAHYIFLAHAPNDLYRVISYRKHCLLLFREIPFDFKEILIINKMREQNAGSFYLIGAFRDLKSARGIPADLGRPHYTELPENIDELTDGKHLFSVAQTFTISRNTPDRIPGSGLGGEEIDHFADFIKLACNHPHWRRQLDDTWNSHPFTIDGLRWASVTHYIEAAKFRKGFPEFYRKFSLDTPGKLSTDCDMAKNVADLKKREYDQIRPEGIRIDADYALGRREKDRATALTAKFSQNQELADMLKATREAIIKIYRRRAPPLIDITLLQIRSKLR